MSSPDAPLTPGHRPRLSLTAHMAVPRCFPRGPVTRFYWGPEGRDPFNTGHTEGGPPGKGDPAADWPSSSPDSGIDLSPTDPACPKLEFSFPPEVDVVKPQEKTKGRVSFSKEQLFLMHERFQRQRYLSPMQIQEMATSLGLTYKQVKTWFQNRRMKMKKINKEGTVKNGTDTLQCDSLTSTRSEPAPGFYPGYSTHGRNSAIGPMVNQFQTYVGHPNAPYVLVPEESSPWWNAAGGHPNLDSHFNKPYQVEPSATQEMDFWQNVLVMDGQSQETGYNFPQHWNFPGASGLLYPNKLLQNYPPPLQKYPPSQSYSLLNYPHIDRAPTNWDDSEEL
ncbi:hypothetical protein NDU88_000766 [Pleurodeles waltl]|uniref:Homeobox domain-containing protein n=1 Tax=Pleurodeles waltl TaxID=8319 RepID=A0AAV7PAM0_PLEWA|nr:hypothetical protein NDU88_000766 [Pleurodeles waltl]